MTSVPFLTLFLSAAVVVVITLPTFGDGSSDSQQVSYDPDIECDLAELIWEYAKKLLPSRGAFLSVYDAVNLEKCNVSKYSGSSDKHSRRYVMCTHTAYLCYNVMYQVSIAIASFIRLCLFARG